MKQLLTFTVVVLCCLSLSNAISVNVKGNNDGGSNQGGSNQEVTNMLRSIQQDISGLKVDIVAIKQDIATQKADIGALKPMIETIQRGMGSIKTDVRNALNDDDDDKPPQQPLPPQSRPTNNNNGDAPHWNPPIRVCFGANTNIMMANGSMKKISQLMLGDETLGGTVLGIQASLRLNTVMYRVKGSDSDNAPFVDVTESHAVLNADGSWSRVHASTRNKVKLDENEAKIHQVVYNIDTSKHLIWVEGIKFPFSDFTEVDADEAEIRMWDAALNQHPPKIDQAAIDAAFVAYGQLSE